MNTPASKASVAPIARSAGEIRRWIVDELATSLKVQPESIDPGAPLESLGVDSLAAIGMTGGLAGWLGRDLPATLMWDYSSIDAIASALADAPAQPVVRPGVVDLQPLGDRPPLFVLPGRGGHPVTFAALASHLGSSHPCYGLTVPGLGGEQQPLTRMEDIAAAVLQNIRRVQPKGPYQLAGYSFGGMLAYEIAQQLTAAGEEVALLALYDTFAPAGRIERPRWQRAALHARLLVTKPASHLQHLRNRLAQRHAATTAKSNATQIDADEIDSNLSDDGDGDLGNGTPPEAHFRELSLLNERIAAEYQPKPYAGRLLLFRATDRAAHNVFFKSDPLHGWGSLALGGVNVIDLPGSHLRLLDAAHAPAAARALESHLI